jgi:eukaryotic-like serine/threonine-protein kinase
MGHCPRCATDHSGERFCPRHGVALADERDLARVGRRFGAHRLVSVLGRGGLGTVYAAEPEAAIKVFHPFVGVPPPAVVDHLRSLAALRHPALTRVEGAGTERRPDGDDELYLCLEHLRGETLADRLEAAGPIAPQRAVGWLRDLAAGLAELHRLGVVHGDLKADNVMLAEGRPRLLDLADGLVARDLLERGVVRGAFGTPQAMAPEVVRGEPADERSDLYGLGTLLFHALTGHPPFDGEDPAEVMRMQRLEPAPTLSVHALPEAWSAPVVGLLVRLLAKDSADRPASAAVVALRLDEVRALPVG